MKFARLLRVTSQQGLDLQGLFQCYKALKKLLKSMPASSDDVVEGKDKAAADAETEALFLAQLDSYLESFNNKWSEQEKTGALRLQAMESRVATVSGDSERLQLQKELLDFHGETLLMMHWSILTYTGLVKIMKKYHKRTGLLVKAVHLQNLLSQPFCSTDLISSMITSVEGLLAQLSAGSQPTASSAEHGSVAGAGERHRPTATENDDTGEGGEGRAGATSASNQVGGDAEAGTSGRVRVTHSASRNSLSAPMAATPSTSHVAAAPVEAEGTAESPERRGGEQQASAGASIDAAGEDAASGDVDDDPFMSSDESDSELSLLMAGQEGVVPEDSDLPQICHQTRLALSTWRHLLNNSTTPSTVMPPPKRAKLDPALVAEVGGPGTADSHD